MAQIDSLRTEKKFKKTEIGEIPVDWEVVTLDEISEEIYRYPTYYNIKYVEQGIPEVRGELIRHNGILETDLSKYRFISPETASRFPRTCLRKGDFVISVRGTMGKAAIVSEFLDGANMTANLMRISPDRNKIFPMFFNQALISEKFRRTLDITSSSTTIRTIKAPELKRLKFVIPPLSEQKKIAEILSTVDQAIEKSNEIIEKTKELKKGLMQELLTRGIGHKKFKKTEIGEIPVEWKIELIGQTCDINPPKKEIDSLGDVKEVPFLPMEFIKEDGEGIVEMEIRKISEVIRGYTYFRENDVLFAKITPCMENGKIAIASNLKDGIGFGSTEFHVLRPNINILLPKILFYWMARKSFRDFAKNFFTGTAGQQRVQKGFFDVVKIPLPSLPEQHKIAEILKSVDDEIEEDRKSLDELQNLKKGLMQNLLTGKVRVRI